MAALGSQGKYGEADLLYLRAIEIREKALGPDHPTVATSLNDRANVLHAQVTHVAFRRRRFVDVKNPPSNFS